MIVINAELLGQLCTRPYFEAKMVFNASGAIVLPVSQQHRDCKAAGISYEDDYRGNALAAMLRPGTIEVRFHSAYGADEVGQMLDSLCSTPGLAVMKGWSVTYRGEPVGRAGGQGT